ncbi:MAG TPA: hypothetical protein GXX57_00875 [Firmicutes bacterium]|nr:hypothetical protein [Bacillota bacterium]
MHRVVPLVMLLLVLPCWVAAEELIYFTDFSSDVSADWYLNGPEISREGMSFDGGWGVYRWAQLREGLVKLSDVTIEVEVVDIRTGNENAFVEIAGRTHDPLLAGERTSGVAVRVFGKGPSNAKMVLYDNGVEIATVQTELFHWQYENTFVLSLVLSGNKAMATVTRLRDGASWQVSGTITKSLGPGNVRIQGRAYNEGPLVTKVTVRQ